MRWGRMVGAALLTLGVLGCAANPRITEPGAPLPSETDGARGEATAATEQAQAPEAGARIESITARTQDDSTLVTIRGSHPLSYTSYDPDATTLVLEMPDADPGSSSRSSRWELPSSPGSSSARSSPQAAGCTPASSW